MDINEVKSVKVWASVWNSKNEEKKVIKQFCNEYGLADWLKSGDDNAVIEIFGRKDNRKSTLFSRGRVSVIDEESFFGDMWWISVKHPDPTNSYSPLKVSVKRVDINYRQCCLNREGNRSIVTKTGYELLLKFIIKEFQKQLGLERPEDINYAA